ncbi:ABC transporter ATP-binding protein [Nocardioides sp. W7]|uniref:ABC transporter ATP-binding protein n=1 Tax=Nocardioides sp. W7 TaxID=2931390 RepID=UPI001FD550D9|nr:ABC transporter ATP-binding protein [Nocardioides sp. W7]
MSLLGTPARRTASARAGTAAGGADAGALRFEGVGRTFGDGAGARDVLRAIDLELAAGEVVALLGPSGCGKSTLLRAAGGLDTPTTGRALIGGSAVRQHDERCAVAFQEPRLLPWRTLRANVALGLPTGTERRAGAGRVDELLELVGLADHADLRPREVSGGMAQRTSLARALARRPGVLLLDEPFGALDALTRMKMQDLLLAVHAGSPTTVLLVTHDVDEALQLADRVVVLGRSGDDPAATVTELVPVPGARPRDRGSVELAQLRGRLLESLGVDAHRR